MFSYGTANGTATAPGDYLATSGTLAFDPGETTQSVSVTVNGDLLDEANETYFVNLTSPVNATIADGQGLGTITDDDPPPELSIDDVTVTEGNSGTTNATFTVSLSAASGRAVSVNYATADGTATAPGDYLSTSGTLAFDPGETTQSVSVTVNGDLLDEANETYFVNLTAPVNATIADGQGLGTITDNDPPPTLSIDDVTVTEGNGGTTSATFIVSLSAPEPPGRQRPVRNGQRDGDRAGRLPRDERDARVRPGQTTQPVSVTVNGRLARRGERDLLRQSLEPGQRDDRRRAGAGQDQRQRPAACALDRRRFGGRTRFRQ